MSVSDIIIAIVGNVLVSVIVSSVTFRVKLEARLTRVETYLKIICDKLEVPL